MDAGWGLGFSIIRRQLAERYLDGGAKSDLKSGRAALSNAPALLVA